MEFRRLGDSGLKVSAVGLGCNNFGSRMEQEAATTVVRAALDAGINLFDTADVYGGTRSEVMLGKALGARRPEVVVATKFGLPTGQGVGQKGGSRRYVTAALEASLKRLGTDYIDLYQIHTPDPETPIEETLRALDDAVRAGKVRYIGHSNFNGWRIADADWTARAGGLNRFVSAQNQFNILERSVMAEVTPACERFGLGFLPWFPLAAGLLTGKYHRDEAPPEGTRLKAWGEQGARTLREANFDALDRLTAFAQARGAGLLDLAFGWLLGQPVVSSVIAGASNPDQIKANVAAAGLKLTPVEVEEVAKLAG